MIRPYNNNLLVELQSAYKHAVTTDAKTVETKSRGLCISASDSLKEGKELVGKIVYFDEFEDTTNYTIDGKHYALIGMDKIRGYDGSD